jgi:CRP/FNR family cyclic AMP-dependent transcriptional regulator
MGGRDGGADPTFLERLPPASRERFEQLGRPRQLRPGTALVLEGDVANRAWLVLDGLLKIESAHRDGRAQILALRGAGELIGEVAALDGGGRSATVTAVLPTTVREFSSEGLRDLVRSDPEVALALVASLGGRLREADRFRVSYMGDDVPHRLAECLRALAGRHGRPAADGSGIEIDLPLSQDDLACLIAASRDSVARTLQSWRRRGLVATGRRTIVLVDVARFGADTGD